MARYQLGDVIVASLPKRQEDGTVASSPSMDTPSRLFNYEPNKIFPIVSACLFFVLLLGHAAYAGLRKTPYMLPLIAGLCLEAVGHMCRTFTAYHPDSTVGTKWYLPQDVLTILAPSFFTATFSMLLVVATQAAGAQHALLPVRWTTALFIGLDAVSFTLQALGSFLNLTHDPLLLDAGGILLAVGSGIQLASYALLAALAAALGARAQRGGGWCGLLWVTLGAATLVAVRSAVRLVVFQGSDGSVLARREIFYYTLQALPVLLAAVLLLALHPSRFEHPAHRPRSSFASPTCLSISAPVTGPLSLLGPGASRGPASPHPYPLPPPFQRGHTVVSSIQMNVPGLRAAPPSGDGRSATGRSARTDDGWKNRDVTGFGRLPDAQGPEPWEGEKGWKGEKSREGEEEEEEEEVEVEVEEMEGAALEGFPGRRPSYKDDHSVYSAENGTWRSRATGRTHPGSGSGARRGGGSLALPPSPLSLSPSLSSSTAPYPGAPNPRVKPPLRIRPAPKVVTVATPHPPAGSGGGGGGGGGGGSDFNRPGWI